MQEEPHFAGSTQLYALKRRLERKVSGYDVGHPFKSTDYNVLKIEKRLT